MRIFSDEEDKMNLSAKDIQGEIHDLSIHPLLRDKKGNCPMRLLSQIWPVSYKDAFNDQLEKEVPVKRGILGADMKIE